MQSEDKQLIIVIAFGKSNRVVPKNDILGCLFYIESGYWLNWYVYADNTHIYT